MKLKKTSIPIQNTMIIALLHYTKPLEEVDRFSVEHRTYLEKFYQEKKIIVSGRQNPPVGGLILFNVPSKEAVQEIGDNDPFVVNDVARYELIEFTASQLDERFRVFLEH